MTYYHPTREAALTEAVKYEEHWYTRASLEPYNGWVIILRPRSRNVLQWPLYDLLEHVELDLGRLRKRPPDRVVGSPLERTPSPRGGRPATPPPPPPKPPSAPVSAVAVAPPPPPPPMKST